MPRRCRADDDVAAMTRRRRGEGATTPRRRRDDAAPPPPSRPPSPPQVFGRDGRNVVVDEGSLDFVRGATVDFEQEMIRSAFAVVNNPNSEAACGCGSSFALKNFGENPAVD